MKLPDQDEPLVWPLLAWMSAAGAGFGAPAAVLMLGTGYPQPGASAGIVGSMLAVSLMGAGIIGAAAGRRFWIGFALAILAGAGLFLLVRPPLMPHSPNLLATGLAILTASLSFAARGALFARSAGGRGWCIAVFVVAGEAAMLTTALLQPGALPDWLLVLLPAQWASTALQSALSGEALFASPAVLIALGGTAAATLMVASLLPRRWPYLIMFSTWLGLSALVFHWPAAPALTL